MIRILIADDHTIFREGLRQILAEEKDFVLIGEATNGDDLLTLLSERACDVILLDLSMPGKSSISLVQAVHETPGDHLIIVLSMHEEHQYIVETLKAGAAGYVTKNSTSDQLIQAVRKVSSGEIFISATVPQSVLNEARAPRATLPHTRLTPRELQVFDLLVAGYRMSHIARDLDLSIKTVSTHKANLLVKMEAETTADLVRYALRHQLG